MFFVLVREFCRVFDFAGSCTSWEAETAVGSGKSLGNPMVHGSGAGRSDRARATTGGGGGW